jgi:hypothetical protein
MFTYKSFMSTVISLNSGFYLELQKLQADFTEVSFVHSLGVNCHEELRNTILWKSSMSCQMTLVDIERYFQ